MDKKADKRTESQHGHTTDEGGINMAALAIPSNRAIMIDKDKSAKFIEDSKKRTIKPEFLQKCLSYSKMNKIEGTIRKTHE